MRSVEARIDRLEAALTLLAEAQTRTEERLGRLETAVERLAEAQRRTEVALQNLAQAVGRLSDTVGYGLEDIARVILPGYLERHLGIRVGELGRRFVGPEGQEIEVNLYGEGEQNGRRVVVLGEAKSRIYGREVEQFDRAIQPVAGTLKEKVVKVMVGYLIHPSASRLAVEREILLVASYQR
jgi:hypothetical protein